MHIPTNVVDDEYRSAVISNDWVYRYWLSRRWDVGLPFITYVMLNPSSADALVDDRTVQSCRRIAKSNGYGGFNVVNLYAWRATDREDLRKAILCPMTDEIGPENDRWIAMGMRDVDKMVCAWGSTKWATKRGLQVAREVLVPGDLWCLGTTKDGHPRHPLYLRGDTPLERWPPPAV